MKKKFTIYFWIIITTLIMLVPVVSASAATTAGFHIKPNMPDNQADSTSSFWNIVLDPGQQQTLYVEVTNEGNKELTLNTHVANASTNLNGQIQYTSPRSDGSKITPEVDYTQYVKVAKTIVLKANESKQVPVEIKMPKKSFVGLATGGIAFYQDPKTIEKTISKNKGFNIENRFQYVASLVMRQHTGTTDIVKPNLDLTKIEAASVNGQSVINTTFVNNRPAYLDNMFTTVTVKGENEYNYSNMQMSMAPNSSFNMPIQTNAISEKGTMLYQALVPGKYQAHVVVYGKIDENGQYQNVKTPDGKTRNYRYRWVFNKDFDITSEQASSLNNKNLFKPKSNNILLWGIVVVAIVLVIGLLIFLFTNRKKEVIVQHNETLKYLVQSDDNLAFEGDEITKATVFRNKRKAKQVTKNFKNVKIIEYKNNTKT